MNQTRLDELWLIAIASDTEALRLKKAIASHGVFTKVICQVATLNTMDVVDCGVRQQALGEHFSDTYVRRREFEGETWGPWRSCGFVSST